MVLFLDLLPFLFQREKRDKDIDIIGSDGDVTKGSKASSTKHEKEKRPQQGESQNNPQHKEVEISSCASNVTTAGSRKKHNQQPHNTYTQTGGGTHNPQIQGVSEIANKGSINMGSSSGMTNHFNNSGNNANKQIQGVNGSQITM